MAEGVDSFRWLPRGIAAFYRDWQADPPEHTPWTALRRPLAESRLGLLTSAGIHVEGRQPPFDVERERREPAWGDPSHRTIPRDVPRDAIGASHLHVSNDFVRRDLNVALPLDRAEEAVRDGQVGDLARSHFSVMGFQLDTSEWERRTGPEIAERWTEEGVDVALLTPV